MFPILLRICNSSLTPEREAPALQAPATNIQDTWDNGVLVHPVIDVKTHDINVRTSSTYPLGGSTSPPNAFDHSFAYSALTRSLDLTPRDH